MITLLEITEVNGKRQEIDYNNRKTEFANMEELDMYREYLQKKLGKQIFFTYANK